MKLASLFLLGAILVAPSLSVRILPPQVDTKEVDSGSNACPTQQDEAAAVSEVRGSVDSLITSTCLLYTSPSPRDATLSRMPSSA